MTINRPLFSDIFTKFFEIFLPRPFYFLPPLSRLKLNRHERIQRAYRVFPPSQLSISPRDCLTRDRTGSSRKFFSFLLDRGETRIKFRPFLVPFYISSHSPRPFIAPVVVIGASIRDPEDNIQRRIIREDRPRLRNLFVDVEVCPFCASSLETRAEPSTSATNPSDREGIRRRAQSSDTTMTLAR